MSLRVIAIIVTTAWLLPRVALAGEWSYCLAPSDAQKRVYISAPFPIAKPAGEIESDFNRILSAMKIEHDDVQCPLAHDEAAAVIMREHAIRFNREFGREIISLTWPTS
jgi:hypothetical protein